MPHNAYILNQVLSGWWTSNNFFLFFKFAGADLCHMTLHS